MFLSNMMSAIRAIQRDPWHAAVNVLSLAIALAASLLIALYVRHELSYEDFITDPDQVYRVEFAGQLPGREVDRFAVSNYPLPELLNSDYGEQLVATRLTQRGGVVEVDGVRSRRAIAIADENFFTVLDLPVVEGDAVAAMAEPDAVILTQSAAQELFGSESAMDRTLRYNDMTDLRVRAILADPPSNTQFTFDMLGSITNPAFAFPPQMATNWGNVVQETFLRMKGATPAEAIERQLPEFVARHKPPNSFTVFLSMRPLRQLHLAASPDGKISTRNAVAIAALSATGAFLIFIACFSYINLATARSLLRVKEVGLRKVLGGRTGHLTLQFFAESVVVTAIAFAIAVGLTIAVLPVFANLVARDLALGDLADPIFVAVAVGLFAFVGVAAGAYPALVLASRKPVELFQMKSSTGGAGSFLRTGIVSIQFAMTAALMIAAAVVFAQINYLRNIDLGFDESGLLMIQLFPDQVQDGRDRVFREELLKSPYITDVSGTGITPRPAYELYMPLARAGVPADEAQAVLNVTVGDRFFEVYGVSPSAGRVLSSDFGDATRFPTPEQPIAQAPIVLSEAAASFLGLGAPADAIDQIVTFTNPGGRIDFTVVGVVPNIHFRLGRQSLTPMVFLAPSRTDQNPGELTARVRAGSVEDAIEHVQQIWAELFPDETMTYQFLEDRIAAANADDERQSALFAFFSGLALFVSCLGLFALSSFVVARRTREIAVRKVLGASTKRITWLLMWDFAKPVLFANVLAWPLAWLAARAWLDRFPNRIELSPAFFLGVSAVALAVALVTVFARTLRAAETRPAMVLRNE